MQLNSADIGAMDTRPRAALINSLSGFKSANLVGTIGASGQSNLAVMSSCVHLGSHPPLLALIVRPGLRDRHTLSNILTKRCYTINHVTPQLIEQAHQTAARYPASESEFDATGLTHEWRKGFGAPFVAEAQIKIGMELREYQTLQINDTHLVIGEVISIDLPDDAVRADNSIDLCAAQSVALSGLDSYHTASLEKRMAYAKPDLPPRTIESSEGETS
ncbi:MAG: flavin reductase family protein [Halioglobus sp.]